MPACPWAHCIGHRGSSMARRLQAVTDKSVAASQFLSIEQSPAPRQRNRLDGALFRQWIGTLGTAHNKRFRNGRRAVFRLQRANGADRRGVHLGGRLAFDDDEALWCKLDQNIDLVTIRGTPEP